MKDNIKTQENNQKDSLISTILEEGYNYRVDILIITLFLWLSLTYIGDNYSIATFYKAAGILFFTCMFYYLYLLYKGK